VNETRSERTSRGFSLAELLVVVAILGLAVAIAVPLVAEQVRQGASRGAADQFAADLKAARMCAIAKRPAGGLPFTVYPHPTNAYEYTDGRGRLRRVALPSGVRIVSSTTPITFRADGSLASSATTVIEATLTGGAIDRWTITTSVLGIPTVVHERVNS
jgi:prepilin-type N-terminal cleavage/methylation domain-containing protein